MADETYRASRLSHPSQPNPPLDWGDIWRVTAAPDDAVGRDGDLAVDVNTGDVYEKASGSWALFTGGSSGTTEVFGSTTVNDPNGVQSATGRAIFIGADMSVWVKNTAGSSNNQWTQKLT